MYDVFYIQTSFSEERYNKIKYYVLYLQSFLYIKTITYNLNKKKTKIKWNVSIELCVIYTLSDALFMIFLELCMIHTFRRFV